MNNVKTNFTFQEMREYAKAAFNAAKEGQIEKIPVIIDQYGSINLEEHFLPNKYKTFEDWESVQPNP